MIKLLFTIYHILLYNSVVKAREVEGMKGHKRHLFIWKLLLPPLRLFMRLKYNYRALGAGLSEPCLIVSNHVTNWDPFLLGLTVKNFCYFIASEHIFHNPFLGKLISWLEAPIARQKGSTAGDTALSTIRRLRKGYSVALFPEGNRNFGGENCAIIESTAKLAKAGGVALATHRIRGGYLTSPRWSGDSTRRGKMTGEIVHVYPAAELKKMKAEEIADIIRRDIYENAYDTQREWMIPYKSRKGAEHLERALCLCPRCHGFGTLESRKDILSCRGCGMQTRYTEYGFFEGGALPFDNVLDWDKWQAAELQKMADEAGSKCLAADRDILVSRVSDNHSEQPVGRGELRLYRDRLEAPGLQLALIEISGINITTSRVKRSETCASTSLFTGPSPIRKTFWPSDRRQRYESHGF